MRALIGSFLVVFFLNWPASAHHHYDEGLGFLHNNSLVANNSIIVIFGLIVTAAFMISFLSIRISRTK
jgi:hypothetical protein